MGQCLNQQQLEIRGAVFLRGFDNFDLYELPTKATKEWRSFYLRKRRKCGESKKRAYWLGHNGSRLAKNYDESVLPAGIKLKIERFLSCSPEDAA